MKSVPSLSRRQQQPGSRPKKTVCGFTLIEIMIVVLIIGILLAIAVPSYVYTREQSRRKACIANLRKIQYATDAFLMDHNSSPTLVPMDTDLWPSDGSGYLKTMPQCPGGGSYSIGSGTVDPTCSYGNGHLINGS